MKIKICGLFQPEDIEAANDACPDYVGFVFAKSRRQVSPETAAALKKQLAPGIKAVGVFVNATPEEVADLVCSGVIDLVQLHGNEDEAYLKRLKKVVSCPILKAVRVDCMEDVLAAQSCSADYLLLDHGPGGTGEAFDWSIIPNCAKPFFLAGGIHDGNLELAVRSAVPFAIDLSSGVETNGVKDREKILEVVRKAHSFKDDHE